MEEKGRTLCTPQRARMITVLVSLVAILCTVPEFWELEVMTLTNDITNATEYTFRYTSFSEDPSYDVGYYWFLVLVFTFLPLVLLCVFNGILILTLIRAAKLRKQMSQVPPNKAKFPRNRFVLRGPHVKRNGYRYYNNIGGGDNGGGNVNFDDHLNSAAGSTTKPSTKQHRQLSASTIQHTQTVSHLSPSNNGEQPYAFTNSHPSYTHTATPNAQFSTNGGSACAHIPHQYHHQNLNNKKQPRSSHAKEQQKITKMLITVVLVFIICQLPGALLLSYQTYLSLRSVVLSRYWANVKRMAANVTNVLVSVNASTNFILYSAISLRFRRVFYRVFCLTRRQSSCCPFGRSQAFNSIVETRTDAIQMSSYCVDGKGGKQQVLTSHRPPVVYKCKSRSSRSMSRSHSPFGKESRHWPSDSPEYSSENNAIQTQHGGGVPVANGNNNKDKSYHPLNKFDRHARFYS